ncbi:MAG TPA: hypothetical protein VJZ00_16545, partial [Thermoanaerobaculia bacterium]|nr:hypothetical protein [Thermoanaerobaculia bacterium]
KLAELIERMRAALKASPLDALRIYEEETAARTPEAERLREKFESTMEYARSGRAISARELLTNAPRLFGSPRANERQLLIAASVEQLVVLGIRGEFDALREIGAALRTLVLEGTQQQQFCGRLAVELGQRSADEAHPLRAPVIVPLIHSLRIVLRVGAATTRDSAVEGLGALLKFVFDPEGEFPREVPPLAQQGDPKVNHLYFSRLSRRRLMVFAVAGHRGARSEFYRLLRQPLDKIVEKLRAKKLPPETLRDLLLDTLYARADLLRTLPALVRQAKPSDVAKLQRRAIRFLRKAVMVVTTHDDDEQVLIAFAHYQESVFRTIDVMIKRGANATDFDSVLADAMQKTPRTLVGRAAVCNAQVRAAFALIRTASRLTVSDADAKHTFDALKAFFDTLESPMPFPNLGIAEGCLFVLPFLLEDDRFNDFTRPALDALFARLNHPPEFHQLAETHRQLIASACFRRLILRLMQRAEEEATTDAAAQKAERDVRKLLLEPTTKHVIDVFQKKFVLPSFSSPHPPQGIAGIVIAGTAFETDLLRLSVPMVQKYPDLPSVQRLLLTRILAAQLRAASQDSREIARYALLRGLYANLPTVSLADAERIARSQDLLSALPPRTAEAADADLQEFLEHCGRIDETAPRIEDLPGYVLAMISDRPSSRIADAIAREIDLNLQHWRNKNPQFDFGKLLYQVMLRGPHEVIFDHLLPRLESSEDRRIVALLRRHVASVRAEPNMKPQRMLEHVRELLHDLEGMRSETLTELAGMLTLYRDLFANDPRIWDALGRDVKGGGLGDLLRQSDAIAKKAHVADSKNVLRTPLAEA